MLAARLGAWLRKTGERWAKAAFSEKLAVALALAAVIYTVVTGAAELRYQARAREALAQVKAARLAAGAVSAQYYATGRPYADQTSPDGFADGVADAIETLGALPGTVTLLQIGGNGYTVEKLLYCENGMYAIYDAAEGTGSIDHACMRMATYYEREHKMNQQVGNSLMYPIILGVLIVAVIAILMTFVLPQFKPMFDQMETLPFLTQLLFDISDFVGANWPVLIVVVLLLILGGRILLAQPKVRRQWDRFILHAPVVGVLNRKICTARFASTLSNLYGSGVPIITTLGAARDAIGNRWIESQFGDALDSIRAGHSLSQAIAGIDGFETKLSSSIAVGEETGRLDSLLATISETLDYEAEMTTKRLVTLLEPVMIVIMGSVVGGVVAAVIVPIYQSYGTIGSSSGAI